LITYDVLIDKRSVVFFPNNVTRKMVFNRPKAVLHTIFIKAVVPSNEKVISCGSDFRVIAENLN
jgi:hypothetical protein